MWNRITRSVWAHVILAALAAVSLASALSLARSALEVARDSAAARARLEKLAVQKGRLEEEIRERAQEESVRYRAKARLNLKNPGENIVVVLPDDPDVSAPAEAEVWQRIKNFFGSVASGFFGR